MSKWVFISVFFLLLYICIILHNIGSFSTIFNIFMEKLNLLSNLVFLCDGRWQRGKEGSHLSWSTPHLSFHSHSDPWEGDQGKDNYLTQQVTWDLMVVFSGPGRCSKLTFLYGEGRLCYFFRDSPLLGFSHSQVPQCVQCPPPPPAQVGNFQQCVPHSHIYTVCCSQMSLSWPSQMKTLSRWL